MANGCVCAILSYLLVALHLTMSVSLAGVGPMLPIFPPQPLSVAHDIFPDRHVLLTSRAAPIIQPALNLLKIVDTALTTVLDRPVGGVLDVNTGRPGLPSTFVRVRQPDPRPTTTTAPGTAEEHKEGDKDWSYDDSNDVAVGPTQWHKLYPKCAARLQSPVDILGSTIKFRAIPSMVIRTSDGLGRTPVRIKNDGSSVSVKPTSSNVIIEGGALPGRFVVTNIHFHWSVSDILGSEHKLEGRAFPLEMHLVTFNSKYRNMQEAAGADDGIHVVATLFEMSKRSNIGLSFCTNMLDNITDPGSEVDGGNISVKDLLPATKVPFYRYRGSLTTPPCTENIIWTVYTNPQRISSNQLHKFRSLKLGMKNQPFIGPNVRPVQAMDNRMVYTNNPAYSY